MCQTTRGQTTRGGPNRDGGGGERAEAFDEEAPPSDRRAASLSDRLKKEGLSTRVPPLDLMK